ncbi:MAG: galactokinase [Phycisphaeraceae bacterium]|nr:galactokinase [Phycisphaeraceae bacterium]MCW5767309.1 galactokinase [Phycisphaeraceae bacterium]
MPTHAARAPGRVNLIGEHTDYSEGLVLPMAIDRGCNCVGRVASVPSPADSAMIRIWSENERSLQTFAANNVGPGAAWRGRGWPAYAAGVIANIRDLATRPLPSMDIAVAGDVPIGAGLSSSAALEVSLATIISELSGLALDPSALARVARAAERGYAGVPCGIMDQLVSAVARKNHALLIDCRDEQSTPISLGTLDDARVLVIDSTVKHALVSGEYKRRADGCAEAARILGVRALRDASLPLIANHTEALGDELTRYARHVVTENARVAAFVTALAARDRAALGPLMLSSHVSLRDDFRVSCPELDAIVEAAINGSSGTGGVLGCRMTGGGFGGSAVALVEPYAIDACIERVERTTKDRFGITPRSFIVTPSEGARAWLL